MKRHNKLNNRGYHLWNKLNVGDVIITKNLLIKDCNSKFHSLSITNDNSITNFLILEKPDVFETSLKPWKLLYQGKKINLFIDLSFLGELNCAGCIYEICPAQSTDV